MTNVDGIADWIPDFLLRSVRSNSGVRDAQVSGYLVHARRVNGSVVRLMGVDLAELDQHTILQIVQAGENPNAVVNIKKSNHVMGSAKLAGRPHGIAALTVSELHAALAGGGHLHEFERKNVAYVSRRLKTHSLVSSVEMVCESVLQVRRSNGRSHIDFALTDDYKINLALLDSMLELHPSISAVVVTNSYGVPTRAAVEYAKTRGVRLCTVEEFWKSMSDA